MSDERATYTAEEIDAAVQALSDPERFAHAEAVITHAAPGLQRVLNQALDAGGWFGEAHEKQLAQAALDEDPSARIQALRTLVEEEVRLGMMVGVTAGFELARELAARRTETEGGS